MNRHSFLVRYLIAPVIAAALAVIPFAVPAPAANAGAVTNASTVTSVEAQKPENLAGLLSGADVIVLGELHDNGAHHQIQAELIKALSPRAVVWEMMTHAQAETLSSDLLQSPEATAKALDWEGSGWPEFALYAPVFEAAALAQQFGALVPRAEAQAALATGVARHFGADAARFGLDQALPQAEQAQREADQKANHCNAMPDEMLPMLVDFQRLRDASLAAAAEQAWRQTGGPVVVITGNGHARRDRGLVVYLHRAAPELRVLTLGQMEAEQIEGDFDVTYSSPAVVRPDPCLAFRTSD